MELNCKKRTGSRNRFEIRAPLGDRVSVRKDDFLLLLMILTGSTFAQK